MKKINPKIIELINARGITEEEDYLELLAEKPQKTYDPFLLLNLEAGVDLILSAIKQQKKICIYGDYDADGITATAILHTVLSELTDNLVYYIPSRFEEGYGLNCEALDSIKKAGTDIVITVDLGSAAYEEVEYAKSLGLDIIVTDHHSIKGQKADCILINPKQDACPYPFKGLAGCGVAYKLAQGIQRKSGISKKSLNEVLDLLAIGTIGDIVPLVDENRTFAKYGMTKLNCTKRKGLLKLMEGVSLKPGQIKSENLAYVIVPHINAAGRIMEADVALELLLNSKPAEIDDKVNKLIDNNRERRRLQEEAICHLDDVIEREYKGKYFYIIYSEETHEGIAGIVAGKLKEKYMRPVAILTPSGDVLKGTSRSIEKINLYELLKTKENHFIKFGGHAMACGFSLKRENYKALEEALNRDVEEMYAKDNSLFDTKISADLIMGLNDITKEFCEELEKLSPFGNGWPKPILEIKNVTLSKVIYMGNVKQHARFLIRDCNGASIAGVFFGKAAGYATILESGESVTVFGYPEISIYNGFEEIKLYIEKIEKEVV